MSQTAIPLEFEQYLQNKVSLGEPTDLNEIIFAMIPNLDLSKPIDRTVGLPPLEQWVYQQDVDQVGKSGVNSVVYSVVIQGSQEPFTFNAMFLRDKNVPDSCGMVVYKATETKEVSMALTKSMLMQFDGAASAANVTVDAATWQIDYQARLGGMDEEHRLACLDNYGHTAFVDGFDVTRHDVDQNKYLVAPGVVYVGGLRVQNTLVVAHNVTQKPTTLWLDVHRDGTALSTHENMFKVVASTSDLVDYVDDDGLQHYVCKLAGVEADGSVVDWRVKGGLNEHKGNADPHPQYFTDADMMYHLNYPNAHAQYLKIEHMVGVIAQFHCANAIAGWIDLKGGELSRETDKLLFDYAVTSSLWIQQSIKDSDPIKYAMYFGDGDQTTTFTLPNHHLGHFTRGNPVDVNHGETQGDAIRNISAQMTGFEAQGGMVNPLAPQGAFAQYATGTNLIVSSAQGGTSINNYGFLFDASRVVPTASENRPQTANLSVKIHRGWM
ncbi:phage tail protein [Vibrio splendidus]|uniref:phage tail-collar fiber domain-containing protein n=1 Tax=Vibrio splendidus TaxID=29497 RepID=UPI000C86609D|nr:phage tail protein [Vibrio splendidus]